MRKPKMTSQEHQLEMRERTLAWLREYFELPNVELMPGIPGKAQECVIARVLRKAGYGTVGVTSKGIHFVEGDSTRLVRLPSFVQQFVIHYDWGVWPDLIDCFGQTLAEARIQAQGEGDVPQVQADEESGVRAAALSGGVVTGAY